MDLRAVFWAELRGMEIGSEGVRFGSGDDSEGVGDGSMGSGEEFGAMVEFTEMVELG